MQPTAPPRCTLGATPEALESPVFQIPSLTPCRHRKQAFHESHMPHKDRDATVEWVQVFFCSETKGPKQEAVRKETN